MKPPKKQIKTQADQTALAEGCYWDDTEYKRFKAFTESFCVQSQGRWAGQRDTGERGSLMFTHSPRFYFSFQSESDSNQAKGTIDKFVGPIDHAPTNTRLLVVRKNDTQLENNDGLVLVTL